MEREREDNLEAQDSSSWESPITLLPRTPPWFANSAMSGYLYVQARIMSQ